MKKRIRKMPKECKVSFSDDFIEKYRKEYNHTEMDKEVKEKTIEAYPWLDSHHIYFRTTCYDCGAFIGEEHLPGCDTARCLTCHGQRLGCDESCDELQDGHGDRWIGTMYPECVKYALDNDLFMKMVSGKGWTKVDRDNEDAILNINTAIMEVDFDNVNL